jgi:hypothetical protein
MATSLRQLDVTTSYVALPEIIASEVSILNTSGATLDIQLTGQDGPDQLITIPDGQSVSLPVVSSAREIRLRGPGAVNDGAQVVIK